MRSIIIEISEPDANGCIQVATKKQGKIELFEMVGILDVVKMRMADEKCNQAEAKSSKRKKK